MSLQGFEVNSITPNEAFITVYSPYSDETQRVILRFDEGPSIAQPVAYYFDGWKKYKPEKIHKWIKLYMEHALEKILSGDALSKKYADIPNAITDPDGYGHWKEQQEKGCSL